jgi:hypothetical protein
MDYYGFLEGSYKKDLNSLEEVYEYVSGIQKVYLKRNKSTGEVVEKERL